MVMMANLMIEHPSKDKFGKKWQMEKNAGHASVDQLWDKLYCCWLLLLFLPV
jgi:hypothetical protein